MSIKKIIEFVFDILFLKTCLGCKEEGTWLCDNCILKIKFLKNQSCPVCFVKNKKGLVCEKCQDGIAFDGLIRVTTFKKSMLLRKIIHNYKYKFIKDLRIELGEILKKGIKGNRDFLTDFDLITSVPLHKRRLKERGYNQAELLAIQVSEYFGLKCRNVLLRKKYTKPQMELTKERRERNIEGAFERIRGINLKGKKIIIVDDVATTLSTLNECAKELKKNGAKEVFGIVLAKDD